MCGAIEKRSISSTRSVVDQTQTSDWCDHAESRQTSPMQAAILVWLYGALYLAVWILFS